jgi:hypothetical protein
MQTMLAQHSDTAMTPEVSDEHVAARQWVDWLATQSCTEGDFITQVLLLEDENPDVAFEVLALLDQLHRRRQLSDELFTRVKGRLLQASLGYGGGQVEFSVAAGTIFPPQESRPAAPRLTVAAPAPAPPPQLPESAIVVRTTPTLRVGDPEKAGIRPGSTLKGRYRIVDILQQSDDGMVLEALDQVRADLPDVSQRVTVRTISEGRSRELELVQRLYRLQALAHPCIVRIFDIDDEDGELFFTTEWMAATPLRQLLARNSGTALALQARQSILGSVASVLAYAHSRDVFHGDVHAGNVLFTNNGEVRLQGFVLEGRKLVASAAADRLAYAWMVYEVLWGGEENAPGITRSESLRRPPGVTGEQWRLLKNALENGEQAAGGALLRLFPAVDADAMPFPLEYGRAAEPARQRRQPYALAGTSALIAFISLGGYALVQGERIDLPLVQREPVEIAAAAVEPAPVATVTPAAAAAAAAETQLPPANAATETAASTAAALPIVSNDEPEAVETAPVVRAPVIQRRAVLDLPEDVVQVTNSQPVAKIWVRRRGNLSGPVTFQWWTEASSAQAGRDFASMEPQWEVIPDGAPGIELLVPLVNDSTRTERRAFYVKLHRVGNGGTLGESNLIQVEIIPSAYQRSVAAAADSAASGQ